MVNIIRAEGGWYWAPLPIIFAIVVFLSIRHFSPKKVKEVIIDERTQLIQEKASRYSAVTLALLVIILHIYYNCKL